MDGLGTEMDAVMREAGLSEKATREVLALLTGSSMNIPPYKALRLLKLLKSLKSGEFPALSAPKKRGLLQTLNEITRQNRMGVYQMCALFFGHPPHQPGIKDRLPDEMAIRLMDAGRLEKLDSVKVLVWDILLSDGGVGMGHVSPDDLAFALWLDGPLIRHKLLMFMFRHSEPDRVLNAVYRHASKTGKRIPAGIARQLIAGSRPEMQLEHRCRLVSNILATSDLTRKETNALWADYLRERHRFELIRILSSGSRMLVRTDDSAKNRGQISFNFGDTNGISSAAGSFASRIHAIRSVERAP